MATRKKITPESGEQKQEATGQAAKSATVRSFRLSKAPAGTSGIVEKASKASSAAATHKAPARKPLAQGTPETFAVSASFDTGSHYEEISLEAYYNWLRRGCPEGSAHEDWHAAVDLVRLRHAS